ncbi:hypothetical protein C365_03434 [Cryptococcus neoformans Bt85]|nr:hypothetical protein C365_03434 [Cryptococcus neoformans var. grubii Bt85]
MIAAADSLPIWRGSNHMPVSKPKKMLLIDVAAALGWNASGWRATSSNAMYAWWNIWTEKIEPWQFDPILDHLTIRWNNFRAVEELTEIIRDNLPERKIPCQKGSIADGHWYHKDTTRKEKRFRLRCRLRSCRHSVTTLCRSDTRNLHLSLPPNQRTSTSDDRGRSSKFSLGSRHLSSPFGFFPAISLPSRLLRAIYTCSGQHAHHLLGPRPVHESAV